MKNTRKKLKNIRSKTKRNIKKMGGALPVPPSTAIANTVKPPAPPVETPPVPPATATASTVSPPAPPVETPQVPETSIQENDTKEDDVPKLLSDIEAKIKSLPEDNPNKKIFTTIHSQLTKVELNDTLVETLRKFLSKIDSIKIIDSTKIDEINNKLVEIEEEIKENEEIKADNEKIAADGEDQDEGAGEGEEEGASEEPVLSGKLAHLTFPIELLDAVKNCINHARNYDFVKVGPNGEELT